jgi:hypothetical protein
VSYYTSHTFARLGRGYRVTLTHSEAPYRPQELTEIAIESRPRDLPGILKSAVPEPDGTLTRDQYSPVRQLLLGEALFEAVQRILLYDYFHGEDLVVNGTFAGNIHNWSGTNWESDGNHALHTATQTVDLSQSHAQQTGANGQVLHGMYYSVGFRVGGDTAGTVRPGLGVDGVYEYGTERTGGGPYTETIWCPAEGASILFDPSSDFNGWVDDVTVKITDLQVDAGAADGALVCTKIAEWDDFVLTEVGIQDSGNRVLESVIWNVNDATTLDARGVNSYRSLFQIKPGDLLHDAIVACLGVSYPT